METIQFTGTENKIENLHLALGISDNDMPQQSETRVYVVDADFNDFYVILSDDEFIKLAKEQGRVYTIQGFQEAFNLEAINSSIDVIRFINVVKHD
jgi:non-homologous end joining protein Ku